MSFTAQDNSIFFGRMQNVGVAFQNLREEVQRLRDWYFAEIVVSGTPAAQYADTAIATKAEADALISYFSAFQGMNDNGAVAQGFRAFMLIPFLTNDPAL